MLATERRLDLVEIIQLLRRQLGTRRVDSVRTTDAEKSAAGIGREHGVYRGLTPACLLSQIGFQPDACDKAAMRAESNRLMLRRSRLS